MAGAEVSGLRERGPGGGEEEGEAIVKLKNMKERRKESCHGLAKP